MVSNTQWLQWFDYWKYWQQYNKFLMHKNNKVFFYWSQGLVYTRVLKVFLKDVFSKENV